MESTSTNFTEYTEYDGTLELNAPSLDFVTPLKSLYVGITGNDWGLFAQKVEFWWDIYSFFAILLSVVFFVGFVYAKIRFDQLYAIEMERIGEHEKKWAALHAQGKGKGSRWEAIQQKVEVNSPEAWRLAIIEADILLDEILSQAGYSGHSLGEKLKSANIHSFTTIHDAWEAHKVRNDIAHVGSDFVLTQRTAQETIMRFERVFREFGAI